MRRAEKEIYLDHAAATPISALANRAMKPFASHFFGNPSSLHLSGQRARQIVSQSRRQIANLLFTRPEQITFTSGGTEANNLALTSVFNFFPKKKPHFIATMIEHSSILHTLRELERVGCGVTYLPVDAAGQVRTSEVMKAITPHTAMVTIGYANNEIGTIAPVAEIGNTIRRWRLSQHSLYPLFHTDACQAAGFLELNVEKLHVDLMTINGSKVYGPKGIGALFHREGVMLRPLLWGGDQEMGLRAGTENVTGIVGFATALTEAHQLREKETTRLRRLSAQFWLELQKCVPEIKLNGPEIGIERLPHNVNISFAGVEGETLLLYLDARGIRCSTGSACTAARSEPSHVLQHIGLSAEAARGSLRFSLGRSTTPADIRFVVQALRKAVPMLREMAAQSDALVLK